MERHWLITWTCYGTWLPGDERGFVGKVPSGDGTMVTHNVPGTPFDANVPFLVEFARNEMKGDPVKLAMCDAEALIKQYQETASIKGWMLEAASVMDNHSHVVVSVSGDPDPDLIPGNLEELGNACAQENSPSSAEWNILDGEGFQTEITG